MNSLNADLKEIESKEYIKRNAARYLHTKYAFLIFFFILNLTILIFFGNICSLVNTN